MNRTLQDRLLRFLAQSRDELLGFIRGLSHSAEEAEDIVQEATARTLASGGQVRSPETYLFVVARNLAREKQADRPLGPGGFAGKDAPRTDSLAPSAEDVAIAREAADDLRRAVARLPRQCRAAFVLRLFHGCTYQEVADRMGISVKTVQKHVDRGLHDTRQAMQSRYRRMSTQGGRRHD